MEYLDFNDEIIVGTNEEFIVGYYVNPNEDGSFSLQQSFTNHSHNGRIKKLAINGKFLVSGSTDEYIRIFNLRARKEIGHILPHDGTVTCLEFHESGFLFSGSEDGNIAIFKRGKWEVEGELKGHKSGVTDLAIHPSGKLALSVSKDKQMFIWDLSKGKRAYVAGLKNYSDHISWSPKATHYVIASQNVLKIFNAGSGNIEKSFDFKENIYCFCYITDELIVVGGECNNIAIFNLNSEEEVTRWKAHENRTKCILKMESDGETTRRIVSGSSDGFIKIWALELSSLKDTPKLLGEVDTKCRIICMSLYSKASQIEFEQLEEGLRVQKNIEKRSACWEKYKAKKQNELEEVDKMLKEGTGSHTLKEQQRRLEKIVKSKKTFAPNPILNEEYLVNPKEHASTKKFKKGKLIKRKKNTTSTVKVKQIKPLKLKENYVSVTRLKKKNLSKKLSETSPLSTNKKRKKDFKSKKKVGIKTTNKSEKNALKKIARQIKNKNSTGKNSNNRTKAKT